MDTNELERAIEVAFQGVEKPATSLQQFKLTDQKGMAGEISPEEWHAAGRSRIDSKWQDVPDHEIRTCGCLLAHMQAEEFHYYLPAYMCYSVKHYREPIWESNILGDTVYSLYPSHKDEALYQYTVAQLSLINKEQKKVVVEFLRFVVASAENVQSPKLYCSRNAAEALERYWNRNICA